MTKTKIASQAALMEEQIKGRTNRNGAKPTVIIAANEFSLPVMKLKPQLFMPIMVRQILDGNKTTTSRLPTCTNSLVDGRRVSAKVWNDYDFDFSNAYIDNGPSVAGNPGPFLKVPSKKHNTTHRIYSLLNPANYDNGLCLWVRETFIDLQKTPIEGAGSELYKGLKYWYAADNINNPDMEVAGNYKPNIHMPFDACRLFLKVTGLKAQRIQDISAEDAIAEGIEFVIPRQAAIEINKNNNGGNPIAINSYSTQKHYRDYEYKQGSISINYRFLQPIDSFKTLWQKVHPGSWEKNDWVWSPHFKKIEKPV